jgi:phosphoribosylanthranilate isomerase
MLIKICGIRRAEDLELASALGADLIGLNFFPGSPRSLTAAGARDLMTARGPAGFVGVVVNRTLDDLDRLADETGLQTFQLHGDEVDGLAAPLAERPWSIILAQGVAGAEDVRRLRDRLGRWTKERGRAPEAVLADARAPGLHGGTGRTAPWPLLAGLDVGVPLFLAGGLTPDNVAAGIRAVRPAGVDVASGVESSPGVKDADKLRDFIASARAAACELGI